MIERMGLPSETKIETYAEAGALRRRTEFLNLPVMQYHEQRQLLEERGTLSLPDYYAAGVLSPRYVMKQLSRRCGPGVDAYIRQLAWRDFTIVYWMLVPNEWNILCRMWMNVNYMKTIRPSCKKLALDWRMAMERVSEYG